MAGFLTANWNPLGEVFYRKFELYKMTWFDHMNIFEYNVAVGMYGGPIAATKKEMHVVRSSAKPIISIFNAAGNRIKEFRWQEGGRLIHIAWSASERLICVQDDGLVVAHNIFGDIEDSFDMGEEARDMKINECKVFHSFHDSGIVVMTTANKFWMKTDINKKQSARKLPDVPGLSTAPASWTVVVRDGNMSVLVAKDDLLYMIDQLGQCQLQQDIPIDDPNVISFTEMAVSLNHKYLALLTASGTLWVGSSNLQKRFCEINTKMKSRPQQLVWCGAGAVLANWNNNVLMVGPNEDWVKYSFDTDVVLVSEPDGARVISNESHEFIHRVPTVTEKIFRIGSLESGAMLYEAQREYNEQNKKANEYMHTIEGQIPEAVSQCVEAAGHEFEPTMQKLLLKAASFGKCFVTNMSPDDFFKMCQTLRVLNAVRDYMIGIPLTYKQFELLQMETLIDKLVYRRQYLLARKICQYLKLKNVENRILAHWACYKVRQSSTPDNQIAHAIQEKLGDNSGVSYSNIASQAIEAGRPELAMVLLDHEPKAGNQVPLLIKIEKYDSALRKAIDSGDSNLIYHVIFELKDKIQITGDFFLEIRKSPTALALLMKYYEAEQHPNLEVLYQQDDRHSDLAKYLVARSYEESNISERKQKLREALKQFADAQDEWATKATESEVLLLEKQQQLDVEHGTNCVNKSLHETMRQLTLKGKHKAVEQLRKDFKVPDRRFWWVKVNALAEAQCWHELENFCRSSKKSPIGFRPFVEACVRHGNKQESAKYLAKVSPDEKVRTLIGMGELEQAAEVAFQRQSEDELNMVLQQCTLSDRAIIDRVQRLKAQL